MQLLPKGNIRGTARGYNSNRGSFDSTDPKIGSVPLNMTARSTETNFD